MGRLWRNQSVAVLEGSALEIMMRMIPVVLYMLSQVRRFNWLVREERTFSMDPASLAEDSLRSHLRKVRRGYLADVSDGIMKTLQKKVSSLFGRRLDSLTTTPISLLSKHKVFAATRASKLQAKPAREG